MAKAFRKIVAKIPNDGGQEHTVDVSLPIAAKLFSNHVHAHRRLGLNLYLRCGKPFSVLFQLGIKIGPHPTISRFRSWSYIPERV